MALEMLVLGLTANVWPTFVLLIVTGDIAGIG